MNALSKQAMDALPDKNISAKTDQLLQAGSEFKETWTIEKPGDGFVYISVLKFEQIGFHEDYEIAQTNLALFGA